MNRLTLEEVVSGMDCECKTLILEEARQLAADPRLAARWRKWKMVIEAMAPEVEAHFLETGYALAKRFPVGPDESPPLPKLQLVR